MVTEPAEESRDADRGGDPAPSESNEFVQAVLREVDRRLAEVFRGGSAWVEQMGGEEKVVSRMLAAIPTVTIEGFPHGPLYTTAGLAQWRGVSRQAIHQARRAGRIVGVKHGNRVLYPWFQFGRRGEMLPGLREILPLLAAQGLNDREMIDWLASLSADLSGDTPIRRLAQRDISPVLGAARSAETGPSTSSGPPASAGDAPTATYPQGW